jgi:prophage antirepressor-like protein
MEILPFNFETNEVRTFIDEFGNIWFVAKDVLIILQENQYPDVSNAVKDLDEDELTRFKIVSGGQTRSTIFVSESGLYSLIIRSRKPVAKPFQKWVTREVLPSIRKTGTYSISQQTPETAHQTVQVQNETLDLDFYTQQSREMIELTQLINSQNSKTLYYLDNLSKSLNIKSPLELFKIDLSNYYFIPTELGNFINTTAVETNKILEAHGFQIRENGVWHLTEKGRDFGIEVQNGSFLQIKWKIKSII